MTYRQIITVMLCLFVISACTFVESEPSVRQRLSSEGVFDADISSDGSLAIISVVGGAVEVWDLKQQSIKYSWRQHGEGINLVEVVRFSPDSSVAVTADSDAFALWDVSNGEPIGFWQIEEETSIRDIAVSNFGDAILVGRANGQVMYFEPYTGRRLEFIAHTEKINTVDISANGRYALSGGNDYIAYLWDTQSGQIIHQFEHPHRVSKVVLDQQARFVFTADSQNQAKIWNAQSGQAISQLKFIERQIIFTAAEFSADGQWLLSGSPARRLSLWDVQTGRTIKDWRVKANPNNGLRSAVVYAVGFDNQQPLSISSSGYLAQWE